MKNKHTRKQRIYPASLYMDFLHEIDRVLPTIKVPEHRAIVTKARSLFNALCYSAIMGNLVPRFSVTEEIFASVIETLRCCGIAPTGWPQPPGPEALLRQSHEFVPGWDGTDGTGGQKA